MKRFLAVVALIFLVSCKSKSIVVEAKNTPTHLSTNKILENYYNNKIDFSTLYINANIKYTDSKQSQEAVAEIKIKKDEQILITIRYLGFTVAKVLIKPKAVSYYEKINGDYFEGDFSFLSQFLGTDLDFNKVQNLLLGRAVDDLKKGNYVQSYVNQSVILSDKEKANTKKSFYFDTNTFLLQKQEITQTAEVRRIQIAYSNFKETDKINLPFTININTSEKNNKTEVNLEYSTAKFNEELSFPYSVPNGYKRIIIN